MMPSTGFLLLFNVILLQMALLQAAPTPSMSTPSMSTQPAAVVMDESGYLRQISSGAHVANKIATLRLAERFNIANASSSSDNIVTRGGDQGTATAWDVTTLMCEQHTLLSALWDIPPAHQDDGIAFVRTATGLLMTSFCKWSEFSLRSAYPSSNLNLTCTTHEIERICQDLETVNFSLDLRAAIVGQDSLLSYNASDVNQWIDERLPPSDFLPSTYQLINSTRITSSSA